MADEWLETIDNLLVERGQRVDNWYHATLTSKEILDRLGKVVTLPNHNNVKRMVTTFYPKSTIESLGANGWKFNVRIRSK